MAYYQYGKVQVCTRRIINTESTSVLFRIDNPSRALQLYQRKRPRRHVESSLNQRCVVTESHPFRIKDDSVALTDLCYLWSFQQYFSHIKPIEKGDIELCMQLIPGYRYKEHRPQQDSSQGH